MIDLSDGSALIKRYEWYFDISKYLELTCLSIFYLGLGPYA